MTFPHVLKMRSRPTCTKMDPRMRSQLIDVKIWAALCQRTSVFGVLGLFNL